jgi:hypothetical protein
MPTRQRVGRSEGQRSWTRRPNPLAPTKIYTRPPRGRHDGLFSRGLIVPPLRSKVVGKYLKWVFKI